MADTKDEKKPASTAGVVEATPRRFGVINMRNKVRHLTKNAAFELELDHKLNPHVTDVSEDKKTGRFTQSGEEWLAALIKAAGQKGQEEKNASDKKRDAAKAAKKAKRGQKQNQGPKRKPRTRLSRSFRVHSMDLLLKKYGATADEVAKHLSLRTGKGKHKKRFTDDGAVFHASLKTKYETDKFIADKKAYDDTARKKQDESRRAKASNPRSDEKGVTKRGRFVYYPADEKMQIAAGEGKEFTHGGKRHFAFKRPQLDAFATKHKISSKGFDPETTTIKSFDKEGKEVRLPGWFQPWLAALASRESTAASK